MTRLIDADALKKDFKIEELYWGKRIINLLDNAPTVVNENLTSERPQDEQKDIDIPKMCEECHSESYSNGFDAGYELGKEDAQKHITELNERIEFLMQQIRLWQKWESTVQEGKDCVENMNEQETFIDEERHQDEWTTRRKELQSLCDTCTKYNDCSESTKMSPNYYICACRKYEESDKK